MDIIKRVENKERRYTHVKINDLLLRHKMSHEFLMSLKPRVIFHLFSPFLHFLQDLSHFYEINQSNGKWNNKLSY